MQIISRFIASKVPPSLDTRLVHVLCPADRRMLRQLGLCEAAPTRIVIMVPRFNAICYISECRSGMLTRLQGHRARLQHLGSSFWSQRYASQLDKFSCEHLQPTRGLLLGWGPCWHFAQDPLCLESSARRLVGPAILPFSCFGAPRDD